ncbi:MAG: MarR family transcriptional regulator [Thermoanaerobaculia bacterium]
MGKVLQRRIRQTRFESPFQEAVLNLYLAANHVRDLEEKAMRERDLTGPQYNVLRILKGVHPEGHPRCDIASRMLDRAPDVTRLIDRLEQKGLVERDRDASDRRLSVTRITKKGLELVDRITAELRMSTDTLAKRINPADARELSRICELIYGDEVEGEG